jgi:hypothetical protein
LEVEDDKILVWSLNFGKLQFSPQTLENYRLVPGAYSEILNRIKDELRAEFQYSYEILTLSIWSTNLTKITI